MVKVLVVGYGVIGQRLADGVALQNDMELVGVVDAAPTLSVRALIDRGVGVERVVVTIVRRVADPGDYHRGLVNALQVDKAPNHQAVDLMKIMPHVEATGLLVHTPITHGHFISVLVTPKKDLSVEGA